MKTPVLFTPQPLEMPFRMKTVPFFTPFSVRCGQSVPFSRRKNTRGRPGMVSLDGICDIQDEVRYINLSRPLKTLNN